MTYLGSQDTLTIKNLKIMIKNYFKIALRNLWNYKVYSLINLTGFSIGMVSVILLFFFIKGELSYDEFQEDKDKIYRVVRTSEQGGEWLKIALSSAPFAPALKLDFDGIIDETVRVTRYGEVVSYKDKSFTENDFLWADPNFFDFFSYPLSRGNPKEVFKEVNSLVISQEMAEKYFGKEDPIGKILILNEEDNFTVTGVIKNTNHRSHLEFDFVGSLAPNEGSDWFSNWWAQSFCTYIKLNNTNQAEHLEAQFPAFMEKHLGDDFKERGTVNGLELQDLTDVYFANDTQYDFFTLHGDQQTVNILTAVALAIFLIVCFNYVNIATAISFKRSREVGVRKVLGGNKRQLILQFLTEAFTITFIATVLAISISELLLPSFNSFFNVDVQIDLYNFQNLASLLIITLLLGTLAGLYPAFLMSAFRPLRALKGQKQNIGKGIFLRRGLVIMQFSISVFMIISTLIIMAQLYYLRDKDLGFNQETVALIGINGQIYDQLESFKNTLEQHSGIQSTSLMSGQPGGFHDGYTAEIEGVQEKIFLSSAFVDHNYIQTLGVEIIAGRDFSTDMRSDQGNAVILNEKAARLTGMTPEEIVGKNISIIPIDSLPRKVIGVAKDFHFATLKQEITPLFMALDDEFRLLAIKIKPEQLSAGLGFLEET